MCIFSIFANCFFTLNLSMEKSIVLQGYTEGQCYLYTLQEVLSNVQSKLYNPDRPSSVLFYAPHPQAHRIYLSFLIFYHQHKFILLQSSIILLLSIISRDKRTLTVNFYLILICSAVKWLVQKLILKAVIGI